MTFVFKEPHNFDGSCFFLERHRFFLEGRGSGSKGPKHAAPQLRNNVSLFLLFFLSLLKIRKIAKKDIYFSRVSSV